MRFILGLILLLAPSYSAADKTQVVFAQIGNSVTLPRITWGSAQDKIHVNWKFENQLLISRNPTSSSPKTVPQIWQGRLSLSPNFSLIISPVKESDFVIFTCEQHELMNTHTTTYRLYHVTMSKLSPLLAGKSLFLYCEIENEGFRLVQPTIRWLAPDYTPHTGSSNKNNYTLIVDNISGIHNGKWTCELKYNGVNTLEAKTNVIIVDLAPSPKDPIYTSDSSSNFPIPCSLSSKIPWSVVNETGVTGGNWRFTPLHSQSSLTLLKLQPNPSPVWKGHADTESSLMETQVKNHELNVKISKVSIKDRGNYTCSLMFGPKILKSTVKLEVLQVISSAGKVIFEGNTVNLTCTLGHPLSSELEVNWIPPGSSMRNLSLSHNMVLSIPEARIKDNGRWTCQLTKNMTVLTSATVNLKVEKAPVDIWLVVAIVGGVLVFILLAVISVIIIRRRRQVIRYRRRKKKYCCCKNPQPKGFYRT